MAERRTYTPEQKAEALAMYPEHGATATAKHFGFLLSTVISWAFRAGVRSNAAERMTEASATAYAAFRLRQVELLEAIAELASMRELECLTDENPKLYEIVGARTRAIHDIQLLSDKATGRVEYTGRDELDGELRQLVAALADNDPAPDEMLSRVATNGNGHVANGSA